ncbi:F-box protein FBW2-like [Lotus japonicus]|uniref:F-box protein FBW2-like n=1 Tax=Lotus japonicus TaxID=34305 RepID=UPI00258BDFC4|nr:F-box protein FBW2-like [Lotus japonicus]
MEMTSDFRPWDELFITDAFGNIFSRLSFEEKMNVIPLVFKSWHQGAKRPCHWQEIEIEDWSSSHEPDQIDRMVENMLRISNGSLKKFCVSGVQNQRVLMLIAENAGSLQTLGLPRSNLSNSIMEEFTSKLKLITSLDVSYCIQIGSQALETIGKNCKQLEVLRRNMHPNDTFGKPLKDDEALAIASNMPKIKRLEMTYNLMTNTGILQILSGCHELEHLDLRGCSGVNIGDIFVNENHPRLQVLGPHVVDIYMGDDDEEASDASELEDLNTHLEDFAVYSDGELQVEEGWGSNEGPGGSRSDESSSSS